MDDITVPSALAGSVLPTYKQDRIHKRAPAYRQIQALGLESGLMTTLANKGGVQ